MKDIELASLLVSRVCHDLISPVGALSNGVEVLADENDPVMRDHAIALIAKSAEQAAAKLKLCRLAYGSMGSAGDQVSLGEARDALEGFLKDSKTKLDWRAPAMLIAKDTVKLTINLALAALDTIPRGGILRVTAEDTPDGTTLTASGDGPMSRLTDDLRTALAGGFEFADLDGRRIQPFLTGMIARGLGGEVTLSQDGAIVTLSAAVPHSETKAAAA
ncbi:Protein phosphotransferase ChpT [Alphaproteobacteria bacterium SO-S41]|nr:Protein phosphotransferase ChpT [Alphaproteobacteria bacterium SO-S41]